MGYEFLGTDEYAGTHESDRHKTDHNNNSRRPFVTARSHVGFYIFYTLNDRLVIGISKEIHVKNILHLFIIFEIICSNITS